MIYTLYFELFGVYFTVSLSSLISSTLLLDAASISITSKLDESNIDVQTSHLLHGFILASVQLTALAKILAVDVFPVPLVPQNKYAWLRLSVFIWFIKVLIIWS